MVVPVEPEEPEEHSSGTLLYDIAAELIFFLKCECEGGFFSRLCSSHQVVLGVKTPLSNVFTSHSPTFAPKEVLTEAFDSPEVEYFPSS